ncbi:unnamed protein product, partial [Didymodactylos carnosus]
MYLCMQNVLIHLNFYTGLLTQYDYSNGATLDGICDHFLRMILERSMKFVPKLNVANYVNKDELVQYLHENAGVRVQSYLRYWSYVVQVIRQLILDREYSLKQFQATLTIIKEQNQQMNGLLPFCFEINPECQKYLNDQILAEYILTTANLKDKKFIVLTTSILCTNNDNNTPSLDQVLTNNIKRIEKLQNKLKIMTSTMKDNSINEQINTTLQEQDVTNQNITQQEENTNQILNDITRDNSIEQMQSTLIEDNTKQQNMICDHEKEKYLLQSTTIQHNVESTVEQQDDNNSITTDNNHQNVCYETVNILIYLLDE